MLNNSRALILDKHIFVRINNKTKQEENKNVEAIPESNTPVGQRARCGYLYLYLSIYLSIYIYM